MQCHGFGKRLKIIIYYEVTILATPGLAINGKPVAAGRVPNPQVILNWLNTD